VRIADKFAAFDWRAFAITIALGLAGGAVFHVLRLPLAWLLGPMVALTVAATAGARVTMPFPLYTFASGILGVLMGSSFTPEIFHHMARFAVSMSALVVYVLIISAGMLLFYRRVFGYDPVTAYFSSMPGGIAEMTMIGGDMGGDLRTIALFHGARILLVALSIPLGFRFLAGYEPRDITALGGGLTSIAAADYAILLVCGVIGTYLAKTLRMPAPAMLGGLIVSALAHLSGVTDARLPFLIIAAGQLVLGAAIGCRFAGVRPRLIGRTLLIAATVVAVMLCITVIFAFALEPLTGWPMRALLLAFAPGGLPEMTLVALFMGVDVVFVASHHTVRIIVVVALAPIFLKLFPAAGKGIKSTPDETRRS